MGDLLQDSCVEGLAELFGAVSIPELETDSCKPKQKSQSHVLIVIYAVGEHRNTELLTCLRESGMTVSIYFCTMQTYAVVGNYTV